MTETPQPQRKLEGPARLITANIDEASVRDRRGMPGGISPAERYTKLYGAEGRGWAFETDQHADRNELEHALHEPEFKLANEALMNALRHGEYKTDDGVDARGKIQRQTRQPDTGNVVVYPDGTQYYADRHMSEEKDHA